MAKISGSCLCNKVRFECEDNFTQFHFCHCIQCQKITGSAHAANVFTTVNNITWLQGYNIVKRYDVPERSITKAFCTECGSGVPFVSASGASLIVPAGCLDDVPAIDVQDNIFCEEKALWHSKGIQSHQFAKFPE